MQPGETTTKILFVYDASGAGVTGLTTGSFTFLAYADGSAYTHSSAITEIGSGYYKWTHLQPATAAHKFVQAVPNNTAYRCAAAAPRAVAFEGEAEAQDLDSVYASTVRPVITLTSQGTIGQTVDITLHKDRYAIVVIQCVDSNGAAINMATAYNNYRVAVKSEDQTTTVWTGTGATITPASGQVTVEFPENASFYAALAAGQLNTTLYWDLVADLASTAAKTVPIVPSSRVTLSRSEAAA